MLNREWFLIATMHESVLLLLLLLLLLGSSTGFG